MSLWLVFCLGLCSCGSEHDERAPDTGKYRRIVRRRRRNKISGGKCSHLCCSQALEDTGCMGCHGMGSSLPWAKGDENKIKKLATDNTTSDK